jgi:hypothetical protein
MKLALIGADEDALALAAWAVVQGGHDLVAAYDSEACSRQLQAIVPRVALSENWEELFLESSADAVIVGRGGKEAAARANIDPAERRADQLRKLVQAAVPMIVGCPACEAIVGFEIEMIRRDTQSILVPFVPGASQPAISPLQDLVSAGEQSPIGKVEQVSLEREQVDRSRGTVLVALARDVTLLRKIIGTIQTVSASGPSKTIGRDPLGPKPKELPSLANLNVHFGGDEGLAARWSMGPALTGDIARLTIIGQRGKAIVTMPRGAPWQLAVSGVTATEDSLPAHDEAAFTFKELTHAMAEARPDDDAWLAVCRDQEAAEAVDRSLARGRTIELFNEEHTEEESFKGVMAMGGCLLLMMALGVLFIAVVVEGLRLPMRTWPLWRLWPFYLLVPIVAFLLLQLLQLVVRREDKTVAVR